MKSYIRLSIMSLCLMALLLLVVNIYIHNHEALASLEAGELQAKLELLDEDNAELESQLLMFSSLNTVASRAAELGYINNREFVSLYDPVQVALGR